MVIEAKEFPVVVAGASLAQEDGRRNADALARAACVTAAGTVHALIVCDGVSSSRYGGDAAARACETFVACANDLLPKEPSLTAAIREILASVHQSVRGRFGGDGICCVVAALLAPHLGEAVVANVGDSAAFLWKTDVLQELSARHLCAQPVFRDGRIVLRSDGTPVIAMGVAQAIGSLGTVSPHVAEVTLDGRGEILCLASDGVFPSRLAQFLDELTGDLTDAKVVRFCLGMRQESADDTTLLLATCGESPDLTKARALCAEYLASRDADRDPLLARLESCGSVDASGLAECLGSEQDDGRASRLLDLLERQARSLDRTSWVAILDAVSRHAHLRQLSRRVARIVGSL